MADYGYPGESNLTPMEQEALDAIGEQVFDTETLETRLADDKDFHDVSVWSIREALKRAYLLGKEAR